MKPQTTPQQVPMTTFVLKTPDTPRSLSIARFMLSDNHPFDPTKWQKPIKMYRQDQSQEAGPLTITEEHYKKASGEKRASDRLKGLPWVLEDEGGKHAYIGAPGFFFSNFQFFVFICSRGFSIFDCVTPGEKKKFLFT